MTTSKITNISNQITKQQYLIALGLFHLAKSHQNKVVEFETELNKLLGLENGSHISDAIYGYPDETLDIAMEKLKIEVTNANS